MIAVLVPFFPGFLAVVAVVVLAGFEEVADILTVVVNFLLEKKVLLVGLVLNFEMGLIRAISAAMVVEEKRNLVVMVGGKACVITKE